MPGVNATYEADEVPFGDGRGEVSVSKEREAGRQRVRVIHNALIELGFRGRRQRIGFL